jgi:hypothetical protein
MKTLSVFVAALFSAHAATAEDSHPSAPLDALKNFRQWIGVQFWLKLVLSVSAEFVA